MKRFLNKLHVFYKQGIQFLFSKTNANWNIIIIINLKSIQKIKETKNDLIIINFS